MGRIINFLRLIILIWIVFVVTGCEPLGLRLTVAELVNPPEWQLKQEITEGTGGDGLGNSVDISENYAIIGAPGVDGSGTDQCAAYIYLKNGDTWQKQQKISSQTPTNSGLFGRTVAISDNYAVITSSGDDKVEIFERSGSTWTGTFNTTITSTSTFFSVDVWGQDVIVGDFMNNNVIIYHKDVTWVSEPEISDSTNRFGYSVAIYGNYAAVGDYQFDGEQTDSGKVFIYQKGASWIPHKQLEPAIKTASGYYGISVALTDNQLVVAERGTAKAYFYDLQGTEWNLNKSISIINFDITDEFGCSVSLAGRVAVIGAKKYASQKGCAHIFEKYDNTWQYKKQLIYPNGAVNDFFGTSVAVSGNDTIIGTAGDDNPLGIDAGTAYVFRRE